MNMSILGWVLVVVGLIAAWYLWSSGIVYIIVSLVVAAVGLWLALKKDDGASVM